MRKTSALLVVLMIGLALVLAAAGAAAQNGPCSRTVNNIMALLKRDYKFAPQARPDTSDYCADLETEINVYIEAALTEPPGIDGESMGAQAFVDFGTRQYVGIMPRGTKFLAVARNKLPGSQMAFVKGENFSVFIDYAFTTLTLDQFQMLPDYQDYDGDIRPGCRASWCQPPGPKPTQRP